MFRCGNVYWAQNNETGKQESLQTKDRGTAQRLLNAKNEAHRQPFISLQIARAYFSASDGAHETERLLCRELTCSFLDWVLRIFLGNIPIAHISHIPRALIRSNGRRILPFIWFHR